MNEILEQALNFKPIARNDDFRVADVSKDGGFNLNDIVVLTKYRNAFKDLLSQVGRMLLSGKFELYKVSFPIKAMSPNSILYAVSKASLHTPIYLNAAALTNDPLERMKFVVT